ncbi:isocyanide synthase family protein [Allokutzneria sp. A3M-2-11 16]|uniref:L-tyrosine/L-tryptophan isonitrile synthase family protein n=1 Tax=Allokutzneria sp. A3M-2-11 16 TaxID=2962043 RepID=UPI0020B88421|nr:isocyanide synthase family protein [Allokutzneria sp. A3M-2-11 16]MCP3797665.1 isocyanide synthase family protein [Allokutzneria sp. A3M-2-11 16]
MVNSVLSDQVVSTVEPGGDNPADAVARLLMAYQRRLPGEHPEPCAACAAPHLRKIEAAMAAGREIQLVLPAFPAKSPNRAKTISHLPDMAERVALEFLQSVCDRIERVYSPGARFVICSDGRVFGDLIGVPDSDVTAYRRELLAMIDRIGAERLDVFDLDDVHLGDDHDAMRQHLVTHYAEPVESVRAEVKAGGHALSIYRGMTRFLFEDQLGPDYAGSRAAALREARRRAYGVIQRSRAWGALLAERFTDAVRLSIHPQACGSAKLGILLMETADSWLTPWHGVTVMVDGRPELHKRADAERLGATLVRRGGRPSHYVLSRLTG